MGKLKDVTRQMDLEGTVLSEISQTENDKYRMISLICETKHTSIHAHIHTKLIDTENSLVVARDKG